MRLLTLELERYGPFTDRELIFPKDAKLCVVYGKNEAGKSCSLAAVTDLLFGIEPRTRYDFLHDGPTMRIGASIEANDGRALTFKRRKGNKNVLLGADGQSIGDDALAPFLGGLSREVFCNAFGLNTDALRGGGEEMLRNDGELGATLFAAASGLRGLTELRATLDREADSIWTANTSKDRRFYQANTRFEDAKKLIRDQELRASDWKKLNDRIAELAETLVQLRATRGAKARETARLDRLKRVAPLLRLIDLDAERIEALGDLPGVPNGYAARLRSHLGSAAEARREQVVAANSVETAKRDLETVHVDGATLETADRVLNLFAEMGAFRNDRRDLPRIRAEVEDFEAQLKSLATRLGQATDEAVVAQQPTDSALSLVQKLVGDSRKIEEGMETNARLLKEEEAALVDLKRSRENHGVLLDPKPLRDALAALNPVLKQLDRYEQDRVFLQTESKALTEEGARLHPPIADLDTLASASLPSPETIASFQKSLVEAEEMVRRERERAADAEAQVGEVKARLEAQSSGGPVPTVEVIGELRRLRGAEWEGLRGTLFQGPNALSGGQLAESVYNFEGHTADADRLADTAAASAERVAAHAADARLLQETTDRLLELQASIEALGRQLESKREEWQKLWSASTIEPASPAEMLTWLATVNALFGRRNKVEAQRASLASIDLRFGEIEPQLRKLASTATVPGGECLSRELMVTALPERIQTLADDWERTRGLEANIQDAGTRIGRLNDDRKSLAEQHAEWSKDWAGAVKAIGHASATPEQAEAALQAWREVPAVVRERDNRARRVAGMIRDMEDFATKARELVTSLAPELATLPADSAVDELNARLVAARQAETLRTEGAKRVATFTQTLDDAETKVRAAEQASAEFAAELPAGADLEAMCDRLAEREMLASHLGELRSNLVAVGDGISEDELRAGLADFEPDAAEAALQQLAGEAAELDGQINECFAEHDRENHERKRLEAGVGAEVALQQRRNAEAEMVAATREWAVLKLSAQFLAAAVDIRREGQHDPLVARAGELFGTLTGGSFVDLGQDFDANDVPHLVGVRPNGARVATAAMSEGARDQLYLALRLAYLEDYARRAEPAPFIGDDIFASFDALRTARGLSALASIGDRVQPILFTHHQHVVDIAREEIGDAVSVIELA
jgi:uncharacterized protein YhaN